MGTALTRTDSVWRTQCDPIHPATESNNPMVRAESLLPCWAGVRDWDAQL